MSGIRGLRSGLHWMSMRYRRLQWTTIVCVMTGYILTTTHISMMYIIHNITIIHSSNSRRSNIDLVTVVKIRRVGPG
ncbi:unnamed protein product [Tilletia controversa]|nr:unnamed protein product [Tilletia controversa]